MMARLVRFLGRRLPDDSMKADPIAGVWYVGKSPGHLPESIPRFTELVFDRALAEHCGRTCGPDCDGDCFAEMYAGIGPSSNDPRNRKRDTDLFDCLPCPEEAADETTEPADPEPDAVTTPTETLPTFEPVDDAATPQGESNA